MKPGTAFNFDSPISVCVEMSRYDFLVIQRNWNSQHLMPAGHDSPISYGFAVAPLVFANAPYNPMFQYVLNPVGRNTWVRIDTQVPGQPSGDAAGRDGLR